MYDIEKIVQPESILEALHALDADKDAIIISGGSDVLIQIREGRLAGCSLVSIHGIEELKGVFMDEDETIRIKPATTFSQVTHNPIIQKYIPALGEAVDQAGGPQLRNIGTIGGNVCNGVTSADSASTLLTLNAVLEITSLEGTRQQPLEDFYRGPGKVNLAHGEILTAIMIQKKDYENFGGHYIKYAMRNAMDIATLGCAVHVKLDVSKEKIEDVRIGFGVAAPNPIRCHKTENSLKGKPITSAVFKEIGEMAITEVNPRTSWRASKEFRIQLIKELSGRALKQAIAHAGGRDINEDY